MLQFIGFEGDGPLQMADCIRARACGKSAEKHADHGAGGSAEICDFMMPAAENVVGPRVVRIEGQSALGFFADLAGIADLVASIADEREFSEGDRNRQRVHCVPRIKRRGSARVVEGVLCECPLLFARRQLRHEIGVLPGDFLQDKRIGASGLFRSLEKLQGAAGVEPGFGLEGVLDQGVGSTPDEWEGSPRTQHEEATESDGITSHLIIYA